MLSSDFDLATNELERKIRALNKAVWDNRLRAPQVAEWVQTFGSDSHSEDQVEIVRQGARYLLTRFTYFDRTQKTAMFRFLYRHHIRYPVIEQARNDGVSIGDHDELEHRFRMSLLATAIVPLGGPSKSGASLLYPLRQHSGLPESCFPGGGVAWPTPSAPGLSLRLIAVDDFTGTAKQATDFTALLQVRADEAIAAGWGSVSMELLFLGGTTGALDLLRGSGLFTRVEAACEFDETHKVFGPSSRYQSSAYGIDWDLLAEEVHRLGSILLPLHPLGWRDCQLVVAFDHNTPDNTLPVFWQTEGGHPALFPRLQ